MYCSLPSFDRRSVVVGFVADKAAIEQGFLWVAYFGLVLSVSMMKYFLFIFNSSGTDAA